MAPPPRARAKVTFVWEGDKYLTAVLAPALNDALQVTGEALASKMRQNFGSEGGGVIGKTASGRNIYKASPPGRFPGVRRGAGGGLLGFTVAGKAKRGRIKVGATVNAPHGIALEKSTNPKMRRPWAARTLKEERQRLAKLFNKAATRALARRTIRAGLGE